MPTPLISLVIENIRQFLIRIFCQLYMKDSFRDELVMKPRNGPYDEGGPLLGWPHSRLASF
jgi:hypothetical protein